MKKYKFIAVLMVLFHFTICISLANDTRVDSLNNLIKTSKQDTNLVNLYNKLCKALLFSGDYEQIITQANKAIELSDKLGYEKGKANAYSQMGSAYRKQGDYTAALTCFDQGYEIFKRTGNKAELSSIINKIGITFWRQGYYPKALSSFFEALKIAEELKDNRGIANALGNIGLVYTDDKNYKEALTYNEKALELFILDNNSKEIAASYTNIGNIQIDMGNTQSAIDNYEKALKLKREIGDKEGEVITLVNLAETYFSEKNFDVALQRVEEALALSNAIGSQFHISECFKTKGKIDLKMLEFKSAKNNLMYALKIAEEIEALELIVSCYYYLTKVDSSLKDWESAFKHHKRYTEYNTLVFNNENTKKITEQKMQYEFDKKESATMAEQERKDAIAISEQAKSRQQKIILVCGLLLAIFFGVWDYRQKKNIAKQKKLSDELLLNILPAEVAEELKQTGEAEAKLIEEVTVLFTDFKGFTALSEKVTPKELVKDLHECFTAFDNIMQKHGLEKIKTIGDAYMAAGGLPTPNTTHATDVVSAALEIAKFVAEGKARKIAANQPYFEIRIGVHTGPVVAGIVGVKKFSYDIWGDTVNTASRMESSGEVGKVNISGTTYQLVKDKFNCVHRGKVQAKGKGEIDMYFVNHNLSEG